MTVSWSITRRAEFGEPMAVCTRANVDFQASIATREGLTALSIYFDPIKGSALAGRNLAGISVDADCRDCKRRGGHVPCSKSTTSHPDTTYESGSILASPSITLYQPCGLE